MPEPHNPFIQPTPLSMGANAAHFYDMDKNGLSGKPRLHFLHANGYPFPCYREFLQALEPDYSVHGFALRPAWDSTGEPTRSVRWGKYADDLIAFLESRYRDQGPVIGVGHSIGATTTMIAAVRRPDLFSKLVLIDPVFLPAIPMALLAITPWFQQKKVSIVKRALGRPDSWETPKECVDFHASKRAYKHFSPEVMRDFGNGALYYNSKAGMYQLAYPKRWEAHVYATGPLMWPTLRKLKTPTLGVRGGQTDVLSASMWQRWQKMHPKHNYIQLDDLGHLAPLENPAVTAQAVSDFLQC